jgi:hypothetical protein
MGRQLYPSPCPREFGAVATVYRFLLDDEEGDRLGLNAGGGEIPLVSWVVWVRSWVIRVLSVITQIKHMSARKRGRGHENTHVEPQHRGDCLW